MKQKQKKKLMMVVLMVGAGGAMVWQLGPMVFGAVNKKPVVGRSAQAKAAKKGKKGSARKPGKPPKAGKPPETGEEPVTVEIDLSRVAQQAVAYKADDLRDPFARTAAEVRLAQQAAASDSLDLTLNGTIRADDRSLAIIDGKVYGPGDSVSAGVSVVSVRAEAVVLAHGSKQVTLTLSRPQLAVGSH